MIDSPDSLRVTVALPRGCPSLVSQRDEQGEVQGQSLIDVRISLSSKRLDVPLCYELGELWVTCSAEHLDPSMIGRHWIRGKAVCIAPRLIRDDREDGDDERESIS